MQVSNLVNQRFAFRRRQLVRMSDRLGCRSTMFASQITRLRNFPNG
jgi:hypothetical protein